MTTYATYHYVLNAQGDVVQLFHQDGTIKATYTYDAWGNVLTAVGDLADVNPLRYRGYYYDRETGWYYLQSRYYDPIVKRFLNADVFASTGQGFLGYNMFAYCNNNPVAYSDETGKLSEYQIAKAKERAWNIGQRASIDADGIHISLESEYAAFKELIDILGEDVFYEIVARSCCEKYRKETGESFPLTDSCVANEIKEHFEAYGWSIGDRKTPNALALLYSMIHSKEDVCSATVSIDIRISDISINNQQALWFDYKHGLREEYYYSSYDPWAQQRVLYP